MDWVRFLDENNIHYVTRGPNTKRSEISVRCPMCGDADPSEHLGVSLTTENWGCLRDPSHRGKSSRTLIKAILGCSSQQAGLIIKQYSHSDPDDLGSVLAALGAENNIQRDEDMFKLAKQQKLEPQFKDFYSIKPRGITKRFFQSLVDRGYENPQDIIKDYHLRCALTGRFKDRIIIPIYLNNELLGWTSRAIGNPINAPRYLMSYEDVKTTVYNYDELKKGGKRLFITEGPFDALKVDSLLKAQNIRATCTFGTSVTMSQIALLRALVKKFDSAWVLFDQGAEGPASNLADWVGCKAAALPDKIKDPGELTGVHLTRMADSQYDGSHYLWQSAIRAMIRNQTPHLVKTLTRNTALLKRLSNKP